MNFLRPKTKQIFQRVLAGIFHPKLVFGVVLLTIVFSNVFILVIPRKVLAEKGATEYGKWYTTDEISIKSMIEVAGPDGVWKDTPFVRVGADTGTIKIRIKLNLEKPESLTFAPDSATNFTQAPRDGVKGPNRLANNTFYENIWPLVGLGSAYGAKDIIKCEWKDVSRLFRFWESRQEIQQCSSKGGKESVNDAMSGSLKAGSEIYNNGTDGFVIGSKELQELTFKPGKTYPIEVWPVLRVNTGDTTLTEAIIASGIDTAVGTLATGFAKPALEVIKKALSKLADVKSGKISATQVVADIVKTTPEMPAEEVKAIAEATLKRFQSLTLTNSLSADIIAQATKSTVDEVVSKGFSGEKAAVVAKAHLEVIANNGGGPKLLNASGQIVETALKEGATKLEPAAAKAATKLGSKAITILGSKWVPIIGWVWTAVDIALYVDTFTKNSLHLYPSNAHKVYVQVYETNAEALAAANEPIPPEVESLVNQEPTSRTGSPTGANDQISGIPKLINQIITAIAQFVVNGIFWLFTTLIAPMLTGVLSVRVYTDAFVNVIYPGWEVLRNVVNIYFIVAIIAIALATLFRVESYKFRPLLIKLIIATLIVNFSLVVCQVILAVADTLQSQFLPNNAEVIGALAKDLMPAQIADIIRSNQLVTNSVFGTGITTLFLMSMAIGGFLVFVAILGYLFVRIVMVWIFLILSPLAFAADVLPSTSGMGQKWWGEFIKYAFFTPVMAFFLNMAAVIAVNYESIFGSISTNLVYGSSDYSKFTVLILATASNILLLVFLFGAVNIAQSFGVFGANVVDGVFKTGVFAPFVASGAAVALGGKGGKTLLGFGAEKFHEKTGIEIRPKEWLEGWKHSREENKLKRKALGQAKALARGSPLGNPTSFFQRYWNIPTVKRLIKGGDRKGRRLISEAAKVKSDYLKKKNEFDLERRKPNPDQAKLHRLKEEMEELKHHYRHLYHEGHLLLAPVDYHTQKEFRGNVDQEKNKIHTKNWHELWDLFQAARHEKEAIRATAILKKVTETYNENEFINNSRYTRALKARESAEWDQILAKAQRENKTQAEITALGEQILHKQGEFFSMSPEGAENFRRLILEEELGLGEQVSMQVMSDVSDTAEDKNHRVLMRMYGSKDGKLYFKPTNEREPEVRAENNKLNAESFLNGCNRLGGFMEVPDDDYDITESRKAVVTAPMIAYYLEHSSDIDPLIRRGRINTSQAKALAENYDIFVRAAEVFNDDIDPQTNELRLYEDLNVAITVPKEILEQGDDAVIKYKTERGGYKTKKALYLQGIAKVKEKGLSLTSDSEGRSTIDKAMEFVHK